jgi:two-component system, LuxR family, response regulator FixJ
VSPVYIIDDEADVRRMTSWLVQELGYFNHPFATATDFLEGLPHLKPGIVLVDLRMDDMSGIDLIRATAHVRAAFPVLLMSGYAEVESAVEAMQAGALDVLRKPLDLKRLGDVLARAHETLQPAAPPSLDSAIPQLARKHDLTGRQTEVLQNLAEGRSNKEIAEIMSIATRTVEMHRAAVMAKLEVSGLPGLLRLLLAETVVSAPPRPAIKRAAG